MNNVTIDVERYLGKDFRDINGGNLGPRICLVRQDKDAVEEYRALDLPMTRLHDVPGQNPGMRLCDIQHIFGNFEADASVPSNYYFAQTDFYLQECLKGARELMVRLGTSIEHCYPHYYAFPPSDYEHWSEICAGIRRHYNHGWANGLELGIKYWEIWNEPNPPGEPGTSLMWNGSEEDYCRLYECAAKRLKAEFPEIKIGGASFYKLQLEEDDGLQGQARRFLAYCRDHHLPLDFFSWHAYDWEPNALAEQARKARRILDEFGFTDTELHCNEWHYVEEWDPRRAPISRHPIDSAYSACHAAAVMICFQDSPLDMSCFYCIGELNGDWGNWGCWVHGLKVKPYYVFIALNKLRALRHRVTAISDNPETYVLACCSDEGEFAALVANFTEEGTPLALNLSGVDEASLELFVLDNTHNLESVEWPDKTRLPVKQGEAACYLVTGHVNHTKSKE